MASGHLAATPRTPRFRLAMVVVLAALSLASALPNYLYMLYPMYGHFGFLTDSSSRVTWTNRKGLRVGDVVQWSALPLSARYDVGELSRLPRAGTQLELPVIRNGVPIRVAIVSEYHVERFGGKDALWLFALKKGCELAIVLLGAALVLIRPTRLSWLFFVYVLALAADGASFWSFLPASLFAVVSVVAIVAALPMPATALTLFTVEAFGEPRSRWQSVLTRIALSLFVFSAALTIGWIAHDQFALDFGGWIPTAATVSLAANWTVAFAILVACGTRAFVFKKRLLAWVYIALAASALCYVYIDAGSLMVPDVVTNPNLLASLSLILSLAAVYVITRSRMFDARGVIMRAAFSTVIGFSIVSVLAALNVALANQIVHVAYIIPLEIVVAVFLGFRLSGLQDLVAAENLATAEAPAARLRGDRAHERDVLTRALARAERTRDRRLIAEVRAYAAFAAWFAGDDREFERHRRYLTFGERPDWSAMAELVACGQSDDALDARHCALRALSAAENLKDPFLQVLACLALAEFDPADRMQLYNRALALCDSLSADELGRAVTALSAGKQDIGMLEGFVNERLRAPRPARPTLEVRFADASVYVYGTPVQLRRRELAMLLTIAEKPEGISIDALADRLWPDLDGDAARNVLNVTLHRLRKALGDLAAITRAGSHYRLREGAVVDIWTVRGLLASTDPQILDGTRREQLVAVLEKFRTGRGSRPGEGELFLPVERCIAGLSRDAGRLLVEDALRRGEFSRGAAIATELTEEHPLDNIVRALEIQVKRLGN